jgi:hypothetical protein
LADVLEREGYAAFGAPETTTAPAPRTLDDLFANP